ncbi:MAG: uridine kinase [Lachnospiraceae bacterium]|jgi:uridine kinase|nr:uridine kinase [Lachnospiraceae bacterium]MBP5653815.1 uridine kinase [Lachnospiraceae bacterium]MCR5427358.1 uridine kinase [Lachnospiraceae bacterium]
MSDCIIIGIAGGTASGKTTVAQKIKEVFGSNVELVSHDYYYLPHNDMTYEERTKINYDHPNAFETDRLIRDIRDLKAGKAVDVPVYDFTIHNRVDDTVRVEPKRVIIVEGILVFENEELRSLMDIKIFVDTDSDERLARRILRDVKERGRSLDSVLTQYTTTVKPMHDQFVEPSKRYADVIIPRGGQNSVALEMINERIKSILR